MNDEEDLGRTKRSGEPNLHRLMCRSASTALWMVRFLDIAGVYPIEKAISRLASNR